MINLISSNSDSLETASVTNFILLQFDSFSPETNPYFSNLLTQVRDEDTKLSDAIGLEKKNDFTKALAEADNRFDNQFKCFKSFVSAYQLSSDPERVEAANETQRLIELNNSNLYRLGYEVQVTAANILLKDFEKPENAEQVAKLPAVSAELVILKEKTESLHQLLLDRSNSEALKEEVTPSYLQRKVVRNLLNTELIPFVDVMSRMDGATFGAIAQKIDHYILELNANIKIRMAKPSTTSNETVTEEQESESEEPTE